MGGHERAVYRCRPGSGGCGRAISGCLLVGSLSSGGMLDTDSAPTLEGEADAKGLRAGGGVANLNKVPPSGCLVEIGFPSSRVASVGTRFIAVCPSSGGYGVGVGELPVGRSRIGCGRALRAGRGAASGRNERRPGKAGPSDCAGAVELRAD